MKKTLAREKPRLSIGLPVFNGEKYLEKALDSILNQTYRNFELIISDNASTDNTPNICRAYATKDVRIKYYRNKRNLGASLNFNRVFNVSSGEYFKWAAHDDILSPEYLSKCISILDQDPSIVLCHSKTNKINENGEIVGSYDARESSIRIDSKKAHERFSDMIKIGNPCWWIFGVARASVLRLTPLMGNYVHSDRNLLAEVSLFGRIYEIPEHLFFRRDHPQAYTRSYIDSEHVNYKKQLTWWSNTDQINYGNFKNFLEYLKSLRRLPLNWKLRMFCYAEIGKWLIREGYFYIGRDLERDFLTRSKLGIKVASFFKYIWKIVAIPYMRARARKHQIGGIK